MNALVRISVLLFATLLAAAQPAAAYGHRGWHGGYGHYWGHPGRVWAGVGLGIGLGAVYYGAPWYYGRPWYPGYVVEPAPVYEIASPPPPAAKAPPEPIFYPRNGQSAAQIEADRRACDRWAMTQPSAMADAGIFHRATLACMDGRGYTSR
jgi:hypothetical protein